MLKIRNNSSHSPGERLLACGHRFVALVVAVITLVSSQQLFARSTFEWEPISLTKAGFAPDLGDKLDVAFHRNELPNLHAVVVARHGKLALERYYHGPDERRGRRFSGDVQFGPKVKHDLRSVSKSIVSLLYGIAMAEGLAPGLDQSLVDQFPEYEDLAVDSQRKKLKVAHALSMTLGLRWDESLPYTDPRNSETAMDMAPDRYRYVLEQPIVETPGRRWAYNGGATSVIARLVSLGTGKSIVDFARERLFQPLGIRDFEWLVDRRGEPIAASGLRLRPRDLARIGQLILNVGAWGETQVVPAQWLSASFTRKAQVRDGIEYGYHWWLGTLPNSGERWIGAFGNGGQRLFVIPDLQMVVVITAGNYNQPGQRQVPANVMLKHLMPALRSP